MNDKPPIMMSMPGGLRLTKDGTWLNDGAPVTHPQIARYFAQRICYSKEHEGYVVEVDGKCVAVDVEDTCFMVRSFEIANDRWNVLLNDETKEAFDPKTLRINQENIFYCRVKSGTERARILRPAMQSLLPHIVESEGNYELTIADKRYPVQTEPS